MELNRIGRSNTLLINKMMMRLLRNIFFLDAPEKGAFFGLTLVFTLPWFLLVWLFHDSRILCGLWVWTITGNFWENPAVMAPTVLAVICFLYAIFLCWNGRARRVGWHLKPQKGDLFLYMAIACAFAAGFVLYVILVTLRLETAFTFRELQMWYTGIPQALGLYGNAWFFFALIGLAFYIASYLLLGKGIAFIGKVEFRKLCGKGVIALWGLVASSYLFCLAMALRATSDYHRSIAELSEFFGRPMTAEALGEIYFNGRKTDAAFWKRMEELLEKRGKSFDAWMEYGTNGRSNGNLIDAPDVIMEDELYSQWKAYFLADESIRELEAMLDAPLPPTEREFRDDKMLNDMRTEELARCRSLARIALWRLRLAIEADDADAAQKAWHRLENICDYLHKEPFLHGSLVWMAVMHFRMTALERLIPWEKTDTAWLETQADRLSELEETQRQLHRRTVYSEAVIMSNTLSVFPTMDRDVADIPMVKLTAIRWFFPMFWWMLADDAAEMMRHYKTDDCSDYPETYGDNWLMGMLGAPLTKIGKERFPSFVAELRIMRGLIAAELHKRRYGSYPDTHEGLLTDPFSGQPLKYRKGACQITRQYCKPLPNDESEEETEDSGDLFGEAKGKWIIESKEDTVDAVQIWSIGPDGIDDGGIKRKAEYGSEEKNKDDIRHLIQIIQ